MGYLDNSTITVDAILTKKGRELLAQGRGAFNITQFALADDEIDYDLWNPAHPLGSDYYGVVIENMPITEAVPDETQSMKYKLVTLPRGAKAIPFVQASVTSLEIRPGKPGSFDAETFYYGGSNPGLDPILNSVAGYTVTLLDSSYVTMFTTATTTDNQAQPIQSSNVVTSRTATSETAIVTPNSGRGSKITITLETRPDVRDLNNTITKTTKIIVTGNETGGRVVIPITVRADDRPSV
jgi:hypothetical protein